MVISISTTPQARPLPTADNLADACHRVITQSQGDPATRFEQATHDRSGQDLVNVVSRLINDHETLEHREKEVRRFPNLLTIEDYVWRNGQAWHFNQVTIDNAHGRARYFDQVVAQQYGLDDFTRYI